MRNPSRRHVAVILAGLAARGCSSAERPPLAPGGGEVSTVPHPLADRIIEAADAVIASGQALGVAIEVSRRGRVVFARGFGRGDHDNPASVTPSTVFRIGSISKPITATAILQLAQTRRLSLDDRLSRYFPRFPRSGEVTIEQLLNHTSGIHNYTEFGEDPEAGLVLLRDHTPEQWVDHIARQTPLYDFTPGSGWHYSNSGFFLAGEIVAQISGKSFSSYLDDHIFSPLGMSDTALDGNSELGPGRALGYLHTPDGGFERPTAISMTVAGGAGGIRSSANDLIKWSRGLFSGALLNRSLLDHMLTPARLTNGELASLNRINNTSGFVGDYGLGMHIDRSEGRRAIGHQGDIPGFSASLYAYPDDDMLTIAILANTQHIAGDLEKEIARIMLSGS